MRRRGRQTRAYRNVLAPAVFRLLPGGVPLSLCARGELGGSFGETLTFARASGKVVSTGSALVTLTTDQPGVGPNGFLVESSATNLVLRSQEFDNAAWTKTRSTVTANAAAAPDGTTTADKLVEDTTATASHETNHAAILLSAQAYTYSVYAKAAERSWIAIGIQSQYSWFNLATGVVGTQAAGNTSTITAIGNGWYRCSISRTATAANDFGHIRTTTGDAVSSYTGDGTSGVYIWGAQLETGTFPSSYMATAGTQTTRAAESGYVSTTGWPVAAGSVELDFVPQWSTAPSMVLFDTRVSTTAGFHFNVTIGGPLRLLTQDGASNTLTASSGLTWVAGARYRLRAIWGGGDVRLYRDDVEVASTLGTAVMPTAISSTAYIGSTYTGTNQASGYISNLSVRR